MKVLREYQKQIVASLSKAIFVDGFKAPLVVSPTGSGKTAIFSHLISRLVLSGKRCVAINHRDELSQQISDALADERVQHGIIAANSKYYDRGIMAHVASVFTLARRMDRTLVPDYVIIDEAHHCVLATTWGRVITEWRENNPNLVVIGVTATPVRLSGEGLGEVFDTMVLGPSTAWLMDNGFLSPYRLFAPAPSDTIDLSGLRSVGGDFNRADVTGKMDKPTITGSAVAQYRKHCDGAPAVAFCSSVAHAEHVADTFKSQGYRAASIDGKMDKSLRREMVRDFSNSVIQVLTSCSLVDEGFDCPGIVAAIDLSPTQSEGRCLQRWGRTLRTAPGKDAALLLDHVQNWQRHGLPDDERQWSLEAKKRKPKKEADPDDIAVKQCPHCYAVCRSFMTKCPTCGHVFPIKSRKVEEVEGELTEIDRETMRAMNVRAQAQATTLQALMTEVGMSMGRAQHVLEARAEKQRLQSVVAEAVMDLKKATGRMEYTHFAIKRMKPKELKETYALCHARIQEAAMADNSVEVI